VLRVATRAVKMDCRAAEEKPVDAVPDLRREIKEAGGTVLLRSVNVSE
jgi:hypothetical protein